MDPYVKQRVMESEDFNQSTDICLFGGDEEGEKSKCETRVESLRVQTPQAENENLIETNATFVEHKEELESFAADAAGSVKMSSAGVLTEIVKDAHGGLNVAGAVGQEKPNDRSLIERAKDLFRSTVRKISDALEQVPPPPEGEKIYTVSDYQNEQPKVKEEKVIAAVQETDK